MAFSLNFIETLLRKDKMRAASKTLDILKGEAKIFEADCGVKLPRATIGISDAQKEFVKYTEDAATEESIKIHVDEIGFLLLRDLEEGCPDAS